VRHVKKRNNFERKQIAIKKLINANMQLPVSTTGTGTTEKLSKECKKAYHQKINHKNTTRL